MGPTDWAAELRRIFDASDWDALSRVRHDLNQGFAAARDPIGLRAFHAEAVATAMQADKASALLAPAPAAFHEALDAAIRAVAGRLAAQPGIQGVYFEYYYDGSGDESNAGNFFLCDSYSPTDEEWGSDFGEEGFVPGVPLPTYFPAYDPDEDDCLSQLAAEAANAFLLADVMTAWDRAGPAGMPLAFANHDHAMVRVPTASAGDKA